MNQDMSVANLQTSVDELNKKVALGAAIDRLHKNRDFKAFLKHLDDKSVTLAKMTCQAQMSEVQELIHKNALITISGFHGELFGINREAESAKEDLAEYEAAIAEEAQA